MEIENMNLASSCSEDTDKPTLDRRTFMGTTGGFLAALASGSLASNSVQAQMTGVHNSVDDEIRVGLVGCGGRGESQANESDVEKRGGIS